MTTLDLKQTQISSAIDLFSKGEINQALDAVQDLIKDYPNEPVLFNIRGACYADLGQLDIAVKNYEEAISIKPDYGEIKSMFVDKSMRGHGVAQKILDQINLEAKKEKLKVLRLETGLKLEAAVRIYIRNGFSFCNCFGEYVENKTSIFMEKSI